MPITIHGIDSRGVPRQQCADEIATLTDHSFSLLTQYTIRRAIAYRITDPTNDYHWRSDACYLEAHRRGRPDIYRDAYERARKGLPLCSTP